MYNEKVNELMLEVRGIFDSVSTNKELESLKQEYMGKNGKITQINSLIKEVPNEEKREFGMKVNEVKNYFNQKFDRINKEIEIKGMLIVLI